MELFVQKYLVFSHFCHFFLDPLSLNGVTREETKTCCVSLKVGLFPAVVYYLCWSG